MEPVVASRPVSPSSRSLPNVGPSGQPVVAASAATSQQVVAASAASQPVVAASAATRRNAALAKIRNPQGGKSKRKHNIMSKKKHTRRKRGVKGGKSRRFRKPCNKNLNSKF